jgi:adenylate cyclase class 2
VQQNARTQFTRVAFRHPTNPNNAYIRVRDEGSCITCSYKEVDKTKTIDQVKEIEFDVSNFDACVLFLKCIGLQQKAFQETYRETRKWRNLQITIDEWPWLKPFIEIEWASSEEVEEAIQALWYSIDDAIFGAVDEIYLIELWIPTNIINNTEVITFDNPPQQFN